MSRTGSETPVVEPLQAEDLLREIDDFAALLRACVAGGASVNFVEPFSAAAAARFWREKTAPPLRAGGLVLLAARVKGRVAGTAQLRIDTPPNQPHRADVAKLLVHPAHRRRGLARALMLALEAEATARDRSLLTLDTRAGDPSERLYRSLGYREVGVIPGYALDPAGRRREAAIFMYKPLGGGG